MANLRNLPRNFAAVNSLPWLPVIEIRERAFLTWLHRASALCAEGQSAQKPPLALRLELWDWANGVDDRDDLCQVAEGFVLLLQLGGAP